MTDWREELDNLVDELKADREHLAVKASLARAELRDEWEALEQKWEHLRSRNAQLKDSLEETGDAVWQDLKKAGEDIRTGYRRIRDLLS